LITDIQTLPQQVFVDKEMWEKIVLNLISNALKFTMHGHIAVSLSLSTSSRTASQLAHTAALSATDQGFALTHSLPLTTANCAELTVSDTGIGIPEDEMAHLGRRFHRIQTPGGRSYEGTGIGTHTPRLESSIRSCVDEHTSREC
jgi:signal transduction histidine kinase